MNKPIKASLMSAFIIPGAGHFYLKRHLVAGLLMACSLGAFYILITIAIEQARAITEKILSGDVPPNIASITQLMTNEMSNSDSSAANWATIILAISWIIGVVDSYRIAKKEEKTDNN